MSISDKKSNRVSRKTNFGGLPKENSELKSAKIVIVPVPYDGTSTWIKGADKGPEAIIEASANMELYDIETDSEVFQQGIFTDKPIKEKTSPEKMAEAVEKIVSRHIKNKKFTVLLGGEHSVSIGAIKAYAENYSHLTVLQLDAHLDMRDEYLGSKFSHACVMARAKELCPIVQVGVRSLDIAEKKYINPRRVFFAEKMRTQKNWQDEAIAKITSHVYITIDLDVFDPGILPSTGTPEPGGLAWYAVLEFLKEVNKKRKIVGFDVVELCPNKLEKSSDFLAAKLIYKLLSYKFNK
jgi:agmatinase